MLKVELNIKTESSGDEEDRDQTGSNHPSENSIENNTKGGESKSKLSYECKKCGKKFQRHIHYKNHVSYMHEEDDRGKGKIQCTVCGKRYMVVGRLKKHMLMHSNGKERIQCSICGKRFVEAKRLENHYMAKHGKGKGKIYDDSGCAKQSSANEEFQKHVVAQKTMLTFNEKVYSCALCGEKFLRDYQLGRHRCHLVDLEQFALATGCRKRKWKSPDLHNNHCPICNKSFHSNEGWRKHMIIHLGQGSFKCSVCSEQFTGKRELQNHMMRRHTTDRPFKCSLCDKTFISKSNLGSHEKVHSEVYYKCCVCGEEFKNISLMKGHECQSDEQFGMNGDKLLCSICQANFDLRSTLIEHLSVHKHTHAHKCPWCSERFRVKQYLTIHHRKSRPRHVSQSANDCPYECKVCLRRFRKQSSLKRHKKVIHCRKKMEQTEAQSETITLQDNGENIPPETVNSANQTTEENMEHDGIEAAQEHINASSGLWGNDKHQISKEALVENGKESNGECTLNGTNSVQYKCDVCKKKKSFIVWGNYRKHMKHAHGRNVERDERLQCAICEEKFLSVESLEGHVVIHNRSSRHYCCALCGEKFFRNHQLTSHRCSLLNCKILPTERGTKQRSWDFGGCELTHCPICNKVLKNHSSWQNHMNLHLRHREFKCSFCSKQFIGRRELRIHMRHHTGVRPYKCKCCPKSFVSPSNLASHEKSHFAIHHLCCMCGMEFLQENDLHAHTCKADSSVNSATATISLKSVCNVCHKSCASRSVLKRHMRVHDDTHPHSCTRCYQGFKHEQDLGKHQRIERLKSECVKDYPFQCSICPNRFDSLRKLKLHEANGHKRTYSRPIEPYSVQSVVSAPPNGIGNRGADQSPLDVDHSVDDSFQGENGRASPGDQGQRHSSTPVIAGVKDYQCLLCDKIFYTKHRLKGHLKIHTGIKPYGCSKCEKRFDNRSSLKYHKKSHKKKKKR
nr:zinc finger protein 665-like [Lytechinus pictus]